MHVPLADPIRPPAFVKRLFIGLLALNLLVVFLSTILLVMSRNTQVDKAVTVAKNLSTTLEREIASSFDQVDQALQEAALEFQEMSRPTPAEIKKWENRLTQLKKMMPILSGIRATDSSGHMVFGLDSSNPGGVSIADRDYYIRLRDDKHAGLIITSPVKARVSGKWAILLARRLNLKDGSFGGVAVASIPLDYYRTIFASLKLNANGSIGLRDGQQRLIVSYPDVRGEANEVGSTEIDTACHHR